MGNKQKTFIDDFEDYMKGFLFRLLQHEFVVSYIDDFFKGSEKSYYTFFILMKVLGSHDDLKFQSNYWSDCYVYFYEKLGIHGILFIPLLLSKGSSDEKNKIIKKYLNEHINNTKERLNQNSNLVMNLIDFKKVILTYISCISTRALQNIIKVLNDDQKKINEPIINELKKKFSDKNIENFVNILLRPYSRQNFYVNAGKFIDDNIDFLTNDKIIRKRLRQFAEKQSSTVTKIQELHQNNLKNKGTNIDNSLVRDQKRLSGIIKKTDDDQQSSTLNKNTQLIDTGKNGRERLLIDNKKENDETGSLYSRRNEWDIQKENSVRKINNNNNRNSLLNDTKNKDISGNSYGLANFDFNDDIEIENKPRNLADI